MMAVVPIIQPMGVLGETRWLEDLRLKIACHMKALFVHLDDFNTGERSMEDPLSFLFNKAIS
jgi:hypothetical protein